MLAKLSISICKTKQPQGLLTRIETCAHKSISNNLGNTTFVNAPFKIVEIQ